MTEPKTPYELADEEFRCEHPASEIRYKVDSLGRRHYHNQCLTCGFAITSALKHDSVSDQDSVRPFNKLLEAAWWKARQERQHEIGAQQRSERERELLALHGDYLKSPEWRAKRAAVLARDGCQCQAMLPGCTKIATQAHHLTYDHWKNEPLFDLVSVCRSCHDEITDDDRANRSK